MSRWLLLLPYIRGDLITETGGYTFGYDNEGWLEEVKKIIGNDTNKFNFQYTSEGRKLRKVYCMYKYSGLKQKEIGKILGNIDYSSVSKLRIRLKKNMKENKIIGKDFEELEKKIN
jgi:hypothetical protein